MVKLPTLPLDRLVLAWGRIVATGKLEDRTGRAGRSPQLRHRGQGDQRSPHFSPPSCGPSVSDWSLQAEDLRHDQILSSSCSTIHCRALELLEGKNIEISIFLILKC